MLLDTDHVPPLVAGCLLRQCGGAKVVWLPVGQIHESLTTAYVAAREAGELRVELLAVLVECRAMLGTVREQHDLRKRVQAVLRRLEEGAV